MDETGKPMPKDAEEFVAEETGGELSNPDDSAPTSDESESRPEPTDSRLSDRSVGEGVGKQSAEFELTPETKEETMKKVQDILEYGVTFTKIDEFPKKDTLEPAISPNLREIFKDGLLGQNEDEKYKSRRHDKDRKQLWLRQVKETKNTPVFVNIVGRFANLQEGKYGDELGGNAIELSQYMNYRYHDAVSIALIVDLASYKELSPVFKFQNKTPQQSFTYRIKRYSAIVANDKHGNPISHDEYGFMVNHRIAPRLFQGIILSRRSDDENLENQGRELRVDWLAKFQKENFQETGILLPIYDSAGDLLWPKQMNYEEVRQFVADRDSKKAQSSSE